MESRADVSWPSTAVLVSRTVVGFAAGGTLILINFPGSEDSRKFVSRGEAKLWMILLALQPAFWAAVAGYAWTMARHYLPRRRQELERIVASVAVIGVLSIGLPFAARLAGIAFNAPLWGAAWKIPALTVAGGFLVGLPSLLGSSGSKHLPRATWGLPSRIPTSKGSLRVSVMPCAS